MATAQMNNLSRRGEELQTQYILRVNAKTEPGRFALSPTDRANSAVKGSTKFVARIRDSGEAAPRNTSFWINPEHYKTGDGETQLTRRPGSEDHLKYKSLGFGTYNHLEIV